MRQKIPQDIAYQLHLCFSHIEARGKVDAVRADPITDVVTLTSLIGLFQVLISRDRTKWMKEGARIDVSFAQFTLQIIFLDSQTRIEHRGNHPESVPGRRRLRIQCQSLNVREFLSIPAKDLA